MSHLSNSVLRISDFFLKDFRNVGLAYGLIFLVATSMQYFPDPYVVKGIIVTHYNNYVIFKQSFFHLLEGKNLYILYPSEHWDLYKYTPSFALFFAPLAYLPDYPGLILWSALNAGLLFYAIKKLPFCEARVKVMVLWFILPESVTSVQNCQSNALMAALIVLCFTGFENRNIVLASFCIAIGFYIKIFALAGAAFFLFHPGKMKFLSLLLFWLVVLLVIPLVITSPEKLMGQYQSWLQMVSEDHSTSDGYSIMAWLRTWFGIVWSKNLIVILGILLFCLPFVRRKLYEDSSFKLLFLCSILIWVVIFNHKAESPTFIIAMCGVGIWYFTQPRTAINTALVLLAFVFTSLSPMDIFPSYLYNHWVTPYVLKGAFCIFIWFRVVYELLTKRNPPTIASALRN